MAKRRGMLVRDLSVRRWNKRVVGVYRNTVADAKTQDTGSHHRLQQWPSQSTISPTAAIEDRDDFTDDADEEDGRGGLGLTRAKSGSLNLVLDCRDQSSSPWLHFPHIELVFLFFAFEGAIASEVSALRNSRCPWVTITAVTVLVSDLKPRPSRV